MAGVLKRVMEGGRDKPKFKSLQHKLRGGRFIDAEFKSSQPEIVWERAEAFVDTRADLHLWDQGRKVMDIVHSQECRDSWLSAAMVVVGSHHWLVKYVVPDDQGFHPDIYAGIFHFFFWRFGEWKEVIVDDTLPTVNGLLAATHFRNVDEMWPALVEKAYLKLLSEGLPISMSLMSTGSPAEALTDLTGGLSEVYSIEEMRGTVEAQNGRFFDTVKELSVMKGLMVVTALENDMAAKIGLHPGMHYGLIQIKKLPVIVNGLREYICLFKLKECTGNYAPWRGLWYQESPEWFKISSPTRDIMKGNCAEMGEFWLTPEELLQYFKYLTVCNVHISDNRIIRQLNINPELKTKSKEAKKKEGQPESDLPKSVKGKITASAETSREESFARNPQLNLVVRDTGFDHVIALMQTTAKTQQYQNIGFELFKMERRPVKQLRAVYFENWTPVPSSLATPWVCKPWREVTRRYRLEPGRYLIALTTEGVVSSDVEFLLRVFTARKEYGLGHVHELLQEEEDPSVFLVTKAQNIFLEHYVLLNNTQYMDAARLHNALKSNFPQDDDEITVEEAHHMMYCRRPVKVDYMSSQEFVFLYKDLWKARQAFLHSLGPNNLMNFDQFLSALDQLRFQKPSLEILHEVFEYLQGDDGTLNHKEFLLSYITLGGHARTGSPPIVIAAYIQQVEDYVARYVPPEVDDREYDNAPDFV